MNTGTLRLLAAVCILVASAADAGEPDGNAASSGATSITTNWVADRAAAYEPLTGSHRWRRSAFYQARITPHASRYASMRIDATNASSFPTAQSWLGPRYIAMSRLDYAMSGAGAAATASMFVGAMANSAGLWDERTSWYLVGAASALGALLGGTVGVPDDPGARVRVSWEP